MDTTFPDKEQLVQLVTQITVQVLNELKNQNGETNASALEKATACNLNYPNCDDCGYCVARRPDVVEQFIESGATRISSRPNTPIVETKYAKYIDHTLLKLDVTVDELKKLCDEARKFHFKSVCVNPNNVPFCAKEVEGTGVGVTAVIGFPLGANTSRVKAFEADEAIRNGASEIDMVINVTLLKSKNYAAVFEDIKEVVRAAQNHTVKVILETASLSEIEKIAGCVLSKAAGARYVKTSTGFGKGGATIEDVRLMRQVVGGDIGVKASGGIHDSETASKMIEAGATRIGASASVAIVTGDKKSGTGY